MSPERKVRRGTAALLSGFAAVEVKKKGGRSVLRVLFYLCRRGGHSIENQTVKRTSSYRFEVGEGSLISLIIKALGSTPLGGEGEDAQRLYTCPEPA